ncbi:MAG TPA: DUF1566 domain-containing protein [bacterium]|nr:DUF1566 domain-containing protein [bacterium]
MKIILIPLIIILMLSVGSCGEINTGDSGNTGNTGDTGDNFPNEHDGLNWSDASSDSMPWDEAITYCENLGGRLPTISELRTLIQNCPGSETGGECKVADDCLSFEGCYSDQCNGCEKTNSGKYSVFGDTYWFSSSSETSEYTDFAWHVSFNGGQVGNSGKNSSFYVRCVQ